MKNIYLFIGNEQLIINTKIDKLVQSANVDEYNIITYDMEVDNILNAIMDASTIPFLSSKKVIIIKNPTFLSASKSEIKHDIQSFLKYLEQPSEDTILIINGYGIKISEKEEVVKKLYKVAEVNDTKELSQVEMEGWLKRQISKNGSTIKDDAVKVFFTRVGKNLMNAKNEAEKLINYTSGKDIITSQDVKDVVTKEVETEVFSLTNAIIDKDKKRIIKIYHDLTYIGKDAVQLLGLISRNMMDSYYSKIMITLNYKQNEIAGLMGVSSGRAFYLMKNSKAFSLDVLENHIRNLASLDYRIKTGQIDSTAGLEFFLLSI